MLCQTYYQPKTIQEAVEILRRSAGGARIIAGGTDLVIDLKSRRKSIVALVDITQIKGLNAIKKMDGHISIGAMVTHNQALRSDVILKWAPALAEACATIGSPQIRNMGTLVGNIVNAMPAADAASALIVFGASVQMINADNKERRTLVEELYKGPGESLVDSSRELVEALDFPIPNARSGSSFQRLSRRKALSLPVLNASVFIGLDEALMTFEEVRIVLGPVAPVPFRPQKAINLLKGLSVTIKIIEEAGMIAAEEASPRTSLRGGKEYRQKMVAVLIENGIRTALKRIHPKFSNF